MFLVVNHVKKCNYLHNGICIYLQDMQELIWLYPIMFGTLYTVRHVCV